MKNKQEYWNKSRVGSGEGSHEEFLKKELFFNSKKLGKKHITTSFTAVRDASAFQTAL